MEHQKHLDQWAEVLAMIDAARGTTKNPDAHTCMDSLQLLATWHSEYLTNHKAAIEAKKAAK